MTSHGLRSLCIGPETPVVSPTLWTNHYHLIVMNNYHSCTISISCTCLQSVLTKSVWEPEGPIWCYQGDCPALCIDPGVTGLHISKPWHPIQTHSASESMIWMVRWNFGWIQIINQKTSKTFWSNNFSTRPQKGVSGLGLLSGLESHRTPERLCVKIPGA